MGNWYTPYFLEAEQQGLPEPEITEIGTRVRMTIYLAETTSIEGSKPLGSLKDHKLSKLKNGSVGEGVNEGVKSLFSIKKETPGKRTPYFAQQNDTSVKNVERWLNFLKDQGKVEFRGAPKTGGYFVIFDNS